MKRTRTLGTFYVFLSAVVFGFTPVLANLSYAGGNNGVNMAFLRALIPLPLLFGMGRLSSRGYRATKRQIAKGALLGCLNKYFQIFLGLILSDVFIHRPGTKG